MTKIMVSTLFLVAGTAFAGAEENGFYWVSSTTGSNSFGATSGSGEAAVSNWRREINKDDEKTYYYTTPRKYDSVEDALNESDKSVGWKQTNPISSSYGIDYTISTVDKGTVIAVDGVYAVNGFTQDAWYPSGNATLDFGMSGALFAYYTLKIDGVNIKIDFSDAKVGEISSRVLLGVANDTYSSLSLGESLSFTADGFENKGKFDTKEAAESALTAGSFAYYVAEVKSDDGAVLSKSALHVVYSAVPEPSAFGLIAGAGVLALAAARRRRKS